MKRPRLERFHCENILRADFGVTFQNLLQHLSGEPECVKIHRKCNRSAMKYIGNATGWKFLIVKTQYVRKEEEAEEEERERREELAVRKKNKNPTQRMWGNT